MIPSPKLDDREFDDIVAEALRLIPRYAPEWTHHNPSDPGITLIELAAWMTDLILYRLNRVPEKNYVAFLNLLGITLKPPQAARALLQFALVDGASRQVIPRGTQVSTPQAADEDTVTFETDRELVITDCALDRCFSYYNETYADNSAFLSGQRPGGFDAFGGAERISRYLYLSDPRLAGAGEASVLRIFLGCPERGGRDLARLLEWEHWNGDRWKTLSLAPLEVDRGEVAFMGPIRFAPTTVNDIEGLWLRGRLAEIPASPEDSEIDTVRVRVEIAGEGVVPDRAFANLENDAYLLLDLGKNAYPFGKEPTADCVLYLACDDLTRTVDAEITIEAMLADPAVIPAPAPSEDLTIAWEYFDGRRWRALGSTGPRGARPGSGEELGFVDDTCAFSRSGVVSFRRPKDMAEVDVNGEARRWIRARIEQGDYGAAGTYTLEGDRWVFADHRPLSPPALRSLGFRYREDYCEVRTVLAENDFAFTDLTEEARTEFTLFQPFLPQADESPALYLGFDKKLPNDAASIYLHMAEDLGPGSLPTAQAGDPVAAGELAGYDAERLAAWESEQRVVWEYYCAKKAWQPLTVADKTSAFTSSGFVDFVAPDDWAPSMKFTEERFWIRARLEMGGYVKPPRIDRVLTNVVSAHHHVTLRDEILGSSDATPLAQVTLLHGPVLEGEVIEVREPHMPPPDELTELGEGAVRETEPGEPDATPGATWVRWRRVSSMFDAGPKSRVYTIDYQSRQVTFGDGRRGMIPPAGKNNILAKSYQIGGGSGGNVNPGTLTALTRAIAYIDTVTNPLAGGGGADRESVAEAKERAPHTIKSRDRAVTAEDFETLALRASTSLARARCIPDRSRRGGVSVIVVPKADTSTSLALTRRLVPSGEVLRYVKHYLDDRRLVGTVLSVDRPRYRDLSIKVALLRRTIGTSDRLRRDIEEVLRRHLHPLVGGKTGGGWDFGRAVVKSEIFHLVEEVPGVEGVDEVEMLDEERGIHVEQLRLEADELPHVIHVHVVEKVRDEIM
ncbi:MAG TPA: putative baseplate assembly protein [Kofleriaceae bacterium]|nr:putative baseplate assembly protein [Kofleriaceae bacterium]